MNESPHAQPTAGPREPGHPGNLDLVRWVDLPSHADARGVLTAIESGQDVPFAIQRVYFVHDVVQERGGHAHRETHQVVTAVHGECDMVLSDGTHERTWRLDRLPRGLYIPPMLFIRMANFSPGTVLASFASTHYDTTRSIRSWADYLAVIGR
ncbi:MAG: FdtA/QdtA family cupin domain-containing protein [Vicinamibacterales bacterium]